jgi:hypothetical protein
MSEPLFTLPPKLTANQQAAYALIHGDGATALEAGKAIHKLNGCGWCKLDGDHCAYAEQAGQSVLSALRRKGLVIRRRKSGLWQRVGAKPASSKGEGEIPY